MPMDVKQVLEDYGIYPDKKQDQYFLVDNEIIDYEIKLAKLQKDDTVLEIGAGPGNLTEKLAEKARVIAVERDRRFVPLLEKIENAEIVNDDALKVIKKLKFNKVVSNIPYSLSQKLLLELLKKKWEIMVLVADKIFAEKLKKNKLGIVLSECADVRVIHGIPHSAFYPPAVPSSIIVLRQKALLDENFWLFLNRAFRSRNKNVKNVFPNCPEGMARKKIHQLSEKELKELYSKSI